MYRLWDVHPGVFQGLGGSHKHTYKHISHKGYAYIETHTRTHIHTHIYIYIYIYIYSLLGVTA